MPKRIQRKRSKGWRKPAGAVYVGRGSKWGNKFVAFRKHGRWQVNIGGNPDNHSESFIGKTEAINDTIRLYRNHIKAGLTFCKFTVEDVKRELCGKDLMCWCSLDDPCHGDVLLELANS